MKFKFHWSIPFKLFMINHFYWLYKLSGDIKCKRGNHFKVGVWGTDKAFCLRCDKTLER